MTDTTPDLDATNVTRAEAADRSRLLTVQDYVAVSYTHLTLPTNREV